MAKRQPTTIVEKVIEGAKEILHPSTPEQGQAEETPAEPQAQNLTKKQKPAEQFKGHKKFDKFN